MTKACPVIAIVLLIAAVLGWGMWWRCHDTDSDAGARHQAYRDSLATSRAAEALAIVERDSARAEAKRSDERADSMAQGNTVTQVLPVFTRRTQNATVNEIERGLMKEPINN
jgi:hypothetical protein